MKTLLLLRHAKSEWSEAGVPDFSRTLNNRGEKAALAIGNYARKNLVRPDLILCSPAERARQTAALLIEAAGFTAELRFDERIYEASWSRLLDIVQQLDVAPATVLMVGHNPGMEDLLLNLTGVNRHMATAAFARIELNVESWAEAAPGGGRLDWLVKPKDLSD
ncbi:MAG: histidine phosphatase family protein [Pyrinomonadaceae bacterium]